jgi:hypothetical protein
MLELPRIGRVELSDRSAAIIGAGEAALERLQPRLKSTFDDRIAVALACRELQGAALQLSGATSPTGRRYALAYAALAPPRLLAMSKTSRSLHLSLLASEPEIRAWYFGPENSDDASDRMQHPSTMLARYKKWREAKALDALLDRRAAGVSEDDVEDDWMPLEERKRIREALDRREPEPEAETPETTETPEELAADILATEDSEWVERLIRALATGLPPAASLRLARFFAEQVAKTAPE